MRAVTTGANSSPGVADVSGMIRTMTADPASHAQWRTLLCQAEALSGFVLGERLELYLLRLLVRVASSSELALGLLELDKLTLPQRRKPGIECLRDIGDQCLLFAGLYPDLAEQRQVRLSHFVSLGRTAYRQAHDLGSGDTKAQFAHLSSAFPSLLDLLNAMRELCDDSQRLTPLHAYDLWSDTGSPRALRFILSSTGRYPVQALPDTSARLM